MTDAMALRLVSSTHEPVAAVGRGIRRYVRVLLENWGLGAEIVEDALVVVEELVANVVDHARTRFALVVQLSSKILRIAVHDECAADPVLQPFDAHAGRGRGLQLVASLSQQWGYEHHDGGKTVWADLAADSSPTLIARVSQFPGAALVWGSRSRARSLTSGDRRSGRA